MQRVVKQKRQRAELDESCAGGGTVGTWDTGVAEGDPRNVMLEHLQRVGRVAHGDMPTCFDCR